MTSFMHTIARATSLRRLGLPLALATLTACAEDARAPHVPTAPSAGPGFARGGNGDNNGRIVFMSNRDELAAFEIYSMNPDGTGVTRLTRSSGDDIDPALSPDGKRIVFATTRDDERGEIYVMNADGTGVTRLTYSPGFDLSPVWSKDGKQIAFESSRDAVDPFDPNGIDVYVMNADGTQVTRITDGPGYDGRPSWSADGKQIAFESDRAIATTRDVYVVSVGDRRVTRVTYLDMFDGVHPSWSPGGKQITFANYDVFVVNADGTQLTQLTTGAPNSSPSWMDGGKKIVFTNFLENAEIYSMNADGTGVTRLTYNPLIDTYPSGDR